MNKTDIELIKKLRKKTGLGILECKNILSNSNFDISLSLKNINVFNTIKANKKKNNLTLKGIIISKISNDYKYGILLEINSETDFVLNNNEFIDFYKKIINFSVYKKVQNFNYIKEEFNKERISLISKFNENINFGENYIFNGNFIYSYIHRNKIGVLISSSLNSDLNILKNISMHIIFNKPEFIYEKDIPKKIIEDEYKIQLEILKLKNTDEKLIEEKINKIIKDFINKKILINQPYIINNNISVKDILYKNNINLIDFKIIEL